MTKHTSYPLSTINYSLFSSLHTHTVFSDGADGIETMCCAAYNQGLYAIGLSCHAPMGKAGRLTEWDGNMKEERFEEYISEVIAARKRWEGKIAVYLGLEIDYVKGLRSALDDDIQNANLDYLIGSVHYLIPPQGDPFTVDGSPEEVEKGITDGYTGDGEAMVNAYWDATAEMIALGGFDIVGHLDLVKKNNAAGKFFNAESGVYLGRVEEITRAISAADLVVEINTGGMNRGYMSEPCPSLPIVRLLRQNNVKVMISADAHNAHDLTGNYRAACQTLHKAGYSSHVIFEGRNNGKPIWRDVPLQEWE